MKKIIILQFFIFISFISFAQTPEILKLKITNKVGYPIIYKFAYIYQGNSKISWSFSNKNGEFDFVIEPVPINYDSIYLFIEDENIIDTIFIGKFNILTSNEISSYIITTLEFKRFLTSIEFKEYSKKYGLIPKRQKGLEKDVH